MDFRMFDIDINNSIHVDKLQVWLLSAQVSH